LFLSISFSPVKIVTLVRKKLPVDIIERIDARAYSIHVRDITQPSSWHERRCACCLLLLYEYASTKPVISLVTTIHQLFRQFDLRRISSF
jgi:hypothetical protein